MQTLLATLESRHTGGELEVKNGGQAAWLGRREG